VGAAGGSGVPRQCSCGRRRPQRLPEAGGTVAGRAGAAGRGRWRGRPGRGQRAAAARPAAQPWPVQAQTPAEASKTVAGPVCAVGLAPAPQPLGGAARGRGGSGSPRRIRQASCGWHRPPRPVPSGGAELEAHARRPPAAMPGWARPESGRGFAPPCLPQTATRVLSGTGAALRPARPCGWRSITLGAWWRGRTARAGRTSWRTETRSSGSIERAAPPRRGAARLQRVGAHL
jgi:hypothetical protein